MRRQHIKKSCHNKPNRSINTTEASINLAMRAGQQMKGAEGMEIRIKLSLSYTHVCILVPVLPMCASSNRVRDRAIPRFTQSLSHSATPALRMPIVFTTHQHFRRCFLCVVAEQVHDDAGGSGLPVGAVLPVPSEGVDDADGCFLLCSVLGMWLMSFPSTSSLVRTGSRLSR